jgi:FKBP-type peptidyl-prolyl cis-trans isomerase 2
VSAQADEPASAEGDEAVIAEGREVAIEYKLTLEDGSVADSNVGRDPLVYQQGAGQILPALERALVGLRVNQTRQVTLPPEEAYGAVDPEAFREVSAEMIPESARREGAMLLAESATGEKRPVRVHEVKQETVVLDLNHPLAGRTLVFDVRVLRIQ